MKQFILIFIILISSITFSQEKIFEFESIDVRTPTGWDIRNISGEVVIYEDTKSHTISIVTENRNYKMYVKSKQLFLRQYSYLYTLIDDDGDESSVRIVIKNKCDDYIELYFYSDRPGEKYFRLCLKKC